MATFEKMVNENNGMTGFHIHVSEGMNDVYDTAYNYGTRSVNRLLNNGILGPKTMLGHCIHVNPAEMDIIRETGTMVCNNPESNMGNAVGCAPVLQMVADLIAEAGADAQLLGYFLNGEKAAGYFAEAGVMVEQSSAAGLYAVYAGILKKRRKNMYLIANGKVITRDDAMPYIENGGVVVEGTKIIELGETAALKAKYPDAEFIDAKGNVIRYALLFVLLFYHA